GGGRAGDRQINRAAPAENGAAHQTNVVSAVPVGVEHGLQKSPAGEAQQTRGERPKKISAERPLQSERQCVSCALRMRAEPARGEKREATDKQKDYATRDVTEPHHPDQRAARQMLRLDSRWCCVCHGGGLTSVRGRPQARLC